ncbi:hypothetical protein DFH08DRAFT_368730 [Mycena albidolilacea]|uniref:Uncharacterized protein n=1 Tax=Mycena albidolilacea TaxID=1033008 RepID=A0AAD7AKE3_9AGAR|nr:hypothetical protein DFH08DRAFT_368730 [Mycena albidolilacea]
MLEKSIFTTFQADFEQPELTEGFSQIKKVNWVFDRTAEERKAWDKWAHRLDERDESPHLRVPFILILSSRGSVSWREFFDGVLYL